MATRTKTTAARKPAAPATRKAPAAAKAPAPQAVAPTPAPANPAPTTSTTSVPDTPSLVVTERARRGDLLDALVDRSPMRRADMKVAMELVLEEMGKMLDAGDELVLPPLGKLIVKKRVARGDGGDMLTVKLKRLPTSGLADDTDT